jgi:RimJ/RimL family protein N-acetyltransferase
LTLRPGWPEDAPALHAAIAHEVVVSRLGRAPWPYTPDDAAAFLTTPPGPSEVTCLIWSHEAREPQLVGGIGVAADEGGHELGYWLTPAAWGRGYATEAARVVVDIARHALRLPRLVAAHHLDNPASARVLAKVGFREIARTRRFSRGRGADVECGVHELDLKSSQAVPMAA